MQILLFKKQTENKMKLPSFNAELSVSRLKIDYSTNTFAIKQQKITPQCIKGCICVAQEGCQCCDSIADIISRPKKTILPIGF